MLPNDKMYIETKKILENQVELSVDKKQFCDWIADRYLVKVLNFFEDYISDTKIKRLHIILMTEKDVFVFYDISRNYDKAKQSEIADFYRNTKQLPELEMLVVFSSFESGNVIEVNDSIKNQEISEIEQKYSECKFWNISKMYSGVTFFFFTEKEKIFFQDKGVLGQIKESYFQLLKKYDHYSFISYEKAPIYFDSKENFDNNYESNWYYYYK